MMPGIKGMRWYIFAAAMSCNITAQCGWCDANAAPAGLRYYRRVDGLTSSGLTATDTGDQGTVGGLARKRYTQIGIVKDFRPLAAALALGAGIAVQDLAYDKPGKVLAEKRQCLYAAFNGCKRDSRKSCDSISPDAVCRCIKSNQGLHHEHYGSACEIWFR